MSKQLKLNPIQSLIDNSPNKSLAFAGISFYISLTLNGTKAESAPEELIYFVKLIFIISKFYISLPKLIKKLLQDKKDLITYELEELLIKKSALTSVSLLVLILIKVEDVLEFPETSKTIEIPNYENCQLNSKIEFLLNKLIASLGLDHLNQSQREKLKESIEALIRDLTDLNYELLNASDKYQGHFPKQRIQTVNIIKTKLGGGDNKSVYFENTTFSYQESDNDGLMYSRKDERVISTARGQIQIETIFEIFYATINGYESNKLGRFITIAKFLKFPIPAYSKFAKSILIEVQDELTNEINEYIKTELKIDLILELKKLLHRPSI